VLLSGYFRILAFLFFAITPSGCGWVDVLSAPTMPEYRQPSNADIERMTQRMMGNAPARQPSINADGVEVVFQTGHAGGIQALALSPNGRYIASSGSQDGSVKVWDVAGGQQIRTFSGFGGMGLGADLLAFSEDSLQLITHEAGGGVKVFEVGSGREIKTVGSLIAGGSQVSANGRFAAVEGQGKIAPTVIDLRTGKTIWTVPEDGHQSPLAISRDGTVLITRKIDTSVPLSLGSFLGFESPSMPTMKEEALVWDVPARKLRRTLPIAASEGATCRLSPDGRYLVWEHPVDRTIHVRDLQTGTSGRTIATGVSATNGMTNSLMFSPDGTMLAVATSEGTARLLEFPGGREVKQVQGTSLNFSPDGRTLIIGDQNGGAPYLQDLVSGKETRLAGGVSGVADLSLSADGRFAVAGMDGGSAKLWDLATGQIARTFDCPGGMAVMSVAVSSASPVLATGCVNGSAWLWDLATGKQLRNLTPPLSQDHYIPTVLRVTRDGHTVVIGLANQLIVYDLSSEKELRRIALPHEATPSMFQQMEDPSAAYEGLDPKLRAMMDAQRPKQPTMDPQTMERINESAQWIRSIALHPNGRLVAIGRSGGTTLWDVHAGTQVLEFRDVSRMQAGAQQQRMRALQDQQAIEEAGSLKSLLPFGLGAPSRSPSIPQGEIVTMDDPSELLDDVAGQTQVARSMAFSPDGRYLLTDGVTGKALWDVATGQRVRTAKKTSRRSGSDPMSFLGEMEFNIDGSGAAFSPDGRLAARAHGQTVMVWDAVSGQDRLQLAGHTASVKALAFSPDGRLLLSGGEDGALRVWNLQTGKELAALIALGREDFVTVTPDQYYRASKARIKGVAFRVKKELYPFEQFDLRFNRPDIVLSRLGMASPEVVQSYRLAYERRLKKMGLTEQMLGSEFHLPEVELLTKDVPVSVNAASLTLRVKASDSKYPLDRLNVFVNDVPVYGTAGLALGNKRGQIHEQEIQVPLVPGRNKIQVSALNQQGVESLKQTVYTSSTAQTTPPEVYVVGIGVSEYNEKAYNLRYAAKDANDLIATYKTIEQRQRAQSKVHTLNLSNQKATRAEIMKAKDWLKQSKANDLVVVFAAGHGMTDEKSDYYFGTHDIDPKRPAVNGLPYQEFENLLDGIPALQKVLLLDTCFSGEIEKDQLVVVAQADSGAAGMVKMRSFRAARGVSVVADEQASIGGIGTNGPRLSGEMLRFQQDWFADLRRGTGAAVISSSSGNEYSLEGEQWKNGVFTYALLTGLKNREADANRDQAVTVSELQSYVIDQVRKLTQGGQNPTVRRENLEYDFVVY
jgi:WD40 repeat protein